MQRGERATDRQRYVRGKKKARRGFVRQENTKTLMDRAVVGPSVWPLSLFVVSLSLARSLSRTRCCFFSRENSRVQTRLGYIRVGKKAREQ